MDGHDKVCEVKAKLYWLQDNHEKIWEREHKCIERQMAATFQGAVSLLSLGFRSSNVCKSGDN